jgi:hypothetical protein
MLKNPSRRRWIRAALLAIAAVSLARKGVAPARADAEPPLLDENSASGKSIGYVAAAAKVDVAAHPHFKAGQSCRNCSQYLGEAGDRAGVCALVLGQWVLADAWCDAWEAKPEPAGPGVVNTPGAVK